MFLDHLPGVQCSSAFGRPGGDVLRSKSLRCRRFQRTDDDDLLSRAAQLLEVVTVSRLAARHRQNGCGLAELNPLESSGDSQKPPGGPSIENSQRKEVGSVPTDLTEEPDRILPSASAVRKQQAKE